MCTTKSRFRTPPAVRPPSPTTAPPPSRAEHEGDCPPLEIVFSFNTAGAYGPMHPTSKTYLRGLIRALDSQLLQKILSFNSSSRTRIAICAHGLHDSPKRKGEVRHVDFTDDAVTLSRFVDMTPLLRWGSACHCYELVLRKVRSLSWTPRSRRVLVLFGCTHPHYGSHPGTDELIHWRVEARCLAQMGIAVYTVEVKSQRSEHEFYRSVAEITGGCHLVLEQCTEVSDVIMAIVSHLESPAALEVFQYEVLDREHDFFSYDMAHLCSILGQHEERVTSLQETEDPPTPQGSDFGDEDLSDDVINRNEPGTTSSEEGPQDAAQGISLSRRSSLRLKNDLKTIDSNGEVGRHHLQLSKQPTLSSVTEVIRQTGNTSLTKQRTVSFNSPEEGRSQKAVKSASFSRRQRLIKLKKAKSLPLPMGRQPSGRRQSKDVLLQPGETGDTGPSPHPPKRPALKKGVTVMTAAAGMSDTNSLSGGRVGFAQPCPAKVYKIDRDAPRKRELISPRTFTLSHLSWSPWTLVISPALPAGEAEKQQWESRSQDTDCAGFRRKSIADSEREAGDKGAALYEVALTGESSTKKRVVFYKLLPKLREEVSWEEQLLGRPDLQQEIQAVLSKKCSVFLRQATFGLNARRSQSMVQAALHKYDYAWNDVQGLHRSLRAVDFL